jgi:3-deoxy-D-manno-octulosonate 8-phosphate phosphatase (KDO 8-P phosphatase)
MAALGIEYVYQGRQDKRSTLTALMTQLEVTPEETAYVGDDLVDLGAMDLAGLSVAVADAHELVRRRADWVTRRGGGRGAAREVCEMLLEARGELEAAVARYLPA